MSGNVYHIYNRGVNKQNIFNDYRDYNALFHRLSIMLGRTKPYGSGLSIKPFPENSFSLVAYCFMDNHYHILIKQNTDIPISSFVNKLFTSYSSYYNRRHDRVGTLFQDTFKAKQVLSDDYLVYLSGYIHLNPQELSFGYPFSSLGEYLGKRRELFCELQYVLSYFNNSIEEYIDYLKNF